MCAQAHGDVPAIVSQLGVRPNRRGSLVAGRDAVGNNERSVDDVVDALGGEDALGRDQQVMVYRGTDHLFRDQGDE